mmetsp:Transcript_134449/g.339645  ORF Transcript_134449/g.339645 Transcript_134449/m.339645 type:complete len:103 (+) Transcript_134449:359-667(+)
MAMKGTKKIKIAHMDRTTIGVCSDFPQITDGYVNAELVSSGLRTHFSGSMATMAMGRKNINITVPWALKTLDQVEERPSALPTWNTSSKSKAKDGYPNTDAK